MAEETTKKNQEQKPVEKPEEKKKEDGKVMKFLKTKAAPAGKKAGKFVGKVVLGTLTAIGTIATVAAVETKKNKQYFTLEKPSPKVPSRDNVSEIVENPSPYHGDVQDI